MASDFYTLPGTPSDLLDSEVVGERSLKVTDTSAPYVEVDGDRGAAVHVLSSANDIPPARREFTYQGGNLLTQTVYLEDGVTINYVLTYSYTGNNLTSIVKS